MFGRSQRFTLETANRVHDDWIHDDRLHDDRLYQPIIVWLSLAITQRITQKIQTTTKPNKDQT